MKINKQFVEILAKKKHGWVGHIIQDMDFLTIKDGVIQNIGKEYKRVEQIYYTVDFLVKEGLINIDTVNYGSGMPTFNPTEFWVVDSDKDLYVNERMTYIDEMNKSYWGKDISITPSFYSFIDNNFKTEKKIQEARNLWLPVAVAIISAFLTAIFSMVFDNPNFAVYILK